MFFQIELHKRFSGWGFSVKQSDLCWALCRVSHLCRGV